MSFLLWYTFMFGCCAANYDNCQPLSFGMYLQWRVDTGAGGVYYNLIAPSVSSGTWIAFGTSAGTGTMIGGSLG